MSEEGDEPSERIGTALAREDVDRAFELLRKARRRYALACLERADAEAIELEELARRVIRRERASDEQYPEADVQSAYAELYHTHVPRLADAGIVDYDESVGTVSLTQLPDPIAVCLDVALALEGPEA